MRAIGSSHRALTALGAALILLLVSATAVEAYGPSKSRSETITKEINFAYCQFVQCGNSGEGEWVDFTGSNTWISKVERTEDHRVSVAWKLAETRVNGKGLESGDSYMSVKETTELVRMSFHSETELGHELSAKVNWRGNISMNDNELNFPLLFTAELRVDLQTKELGFTFEEINTGCEASREPLTDQRITSPDPLDVRPKE